MEALCRLQHRYRIVGQDRTITKVAHIEVLGPFYLFHDTALLFQSDRVEPIHVKGARLFLQRPHRFHRELWLRLSNAKIRVDWRGLRRWNTPALSDDIVELEAEDTYHALQIYSSNFFLCHGLLVHYCIVAISKGLIDLPKVLLHDCALVHVWVQVGFIYRLAAPTKHCRFELGFNHVKK